MKPEVFKYLEDIKLSIDLIEKYTADLSMVIDYEKDAETIDAVERRLAIIGEALFKTLKIEPDLNISEKTKIIKLRHILVHEYNLVTNSTIWSIIKNDLLILKKEIQDLIK